VSDQLLTKKCVQCGKEMSEPVIQDVDLCSAECAGRFWDRLVAEIQSWPKLPELPNLPEIPTAY
jgi:hypothetical protein